MGYDRKYGQVTTEHGEIPDDEPVIVLRARDVHAAAAVGYYHSVCSADRQVDAAHADSVAEVLRQFCAWRDANPHRMKTPDTTPEQMPRM